MVRSSLNQADIGKGKRPQGIAIAPRAVLWIGLSIYDGQMDLNHGNRDEDDGDHELLWMTGAIRAALDKGIDPYTVAEVLVQRLCDTDHSGWRLI